MPVTLYVAYIWICIPHKCLSSVWHVCFWHMCGNIMLGICYRWFSLDTYMYLHWIYLSKQNEGSVSIICNVSAISVHWYGKTMKYILWSIWTVPPSHFMPLILNMTYMHMHYPVYAPEWYGIYMKCGGYICFWLTAIQHF